MTRKERKEMFKAMFGALVVAIALLLPSIVIGLSLQR